MKRSTNLKPGIIHDWFPTLLKAAKVKLPASIAGLDLHHLLGGRSGRQFDRALIRYVPDLRGPVERPLVEVPGMGPGSTICHGDWKLIHYHIDNRIDLQMAGGQRWRPVDNPLAIGDGFRLTRRDSSRH